MRNIDPIKAEEDLREELRERFFAKTKDAESVHHLLGTKCLEWTARIGTWGYGEVWFNKEFRMQKAHRVAWWLAHGQWPNPCALHRCDNPRCVRVDHLFEGTIADNVADMMSKGRGRAPAGDLHWSRLHPEKRAFGDRNGMLTHPGIKKGTLNGRSILNNDDVLRIRELGSSGMRHVDIAKMFGVSRQTVGYVCSGKTWSHVGLGVIDQCR